MLWLSFEKRLWHDLSQIPEKRHGAWVLIGDFNAIKRLSEKKKKRGEAHLLFIMSCGFANFISESGLIDLGFLTGPRKCFFNHGTTR